MYFINGIYWLWAFSVPVIILGIPAWLLYERSAGNLVYSILLLIAGIASGVFLAELVRKRPGLSRFFGRVSETPDVEDRNVK